MIWGTRCPTDLDSQVAGIMHGWCLIVGIQVRLVNRSLDETSRGGVRRWMLPRNGAPSLGNVVWMLPWKKAPFLE